MKRFFSTTKLISAFLIITITASLYSPWLNHDLAKIAPQVEIQPAHAASCPQCSTFLGQAVALVQQNWTAIQSTISAAADTIQAGGTITILGKEFGWDTVAWILAKAVIRSITASIVNWINSGFSGGPSFVTDLEGFLLDTADLAVEGFLQGTDIEFICSPFKLDVQIAVALRHSNRNSLQAQCTIDGIVNNVENFLDGAFAEGGFRGWFEITQHPENTRAGAFLEANAMARLRVLDAQGREIEMLSFGEGFFSKTFCEAIGEEQNCVVDVPAQVIKEQLNNVLDSPRMAALLADEIGESIGVIFSSLVGYTLRSGLAALSGGGFNGGAGSYLDALIAEGQTEALPLIQGQFADAIRNERRFIAIYEDVIAIIDDLVDRNEAARQQARIVFTSTNSEGEVTEREIACYALELPSNLADLQVKASSTIPLGEAAIIVIADLEERFNATTSPEVTNEILNEFIPMQSRQAVIALEPEQISFLNNLVTQYNATGTTDNVRRSIIETMKEAGLVGGVHNEIEISRAEVVDLLVAREDGERFIDAIAAEVARCAALEAELRNNDNNTGRESDR